MGRREYTNAYHSLVCQDYIDILFCKSWLNLWLYWLNQTLSVSSQLYLNRHYFQMNNSKAECWTSLLQVKHIYTVWCYSPNILYQNWNVSILVNVLYSSDTESHIMNFNLTLGNGSFPVTVADSCWCYLISLDSTANSDLWESRPSLWAKLFNCPEQLMERIRILNLECDFVAPNLWDYTTAWNNISFCSTFRPMFCQLHAGQAILAGWCFPNCGWELERNIRRREHEEGGDCRLEVCGERCTPEALYCRGVTRAERSLQHSAFLSCFFWAFALKLSQYQHISISYVVFCVNVFPWNMSKTSWFQQCLGL